MDAKPISWSEWSERERAASGQGVCCQEAQADGSACASPERACESCLRAYALFAATLGVPAAPPIDVVLDAC